MKGAECRIGTVWYTLADLNTTKTDASTCEAGSNAV